MIAEEMIHLGEKKSSIWQTEGGTNWERKGF